ncbi:hypothetical protein AAHH80_37750, partial [Burkholderia pseudomallei]
MPRQPASLRRPDSRHHDPETSLPILAAPIRAALHPVIDEVVHRSVSVAPSKDGYMGCAVYAFVGARVLSM